MKTHDGLSNELHKRANNCRPAREMIVIDEKVIRDLKKSVAESSQQVRDSRFMITNSRIFLAGIYRRLAQDEMNGRLITLLMHLLNLKFGPSEVWRHNSRRNSIIQARAKIVNVLENSSDVLLGRGSEALAKAYKRARKDAAGSSGFSLSTFPEQCPWTYEQMLDKEFFPALTKP